MNEPLWLASASPRRKALLAGMGLRFRVAKVAFREHVPEGIPPEEAARYLAWRKAETARRRIRRGLIITGDTVVALGTRRFGKPRSRADARRILRMLAGRTHRVITGLAVIDAANGTGVVGSAVSDVVFRRLSAAAIAAYVATGEPMDKAGAYAIQGGAGAFVLRIRGSYSNIVGLPVGLLRALLARMGRAPRRGLRKRLGQRPARR